MAGDAHNNLASNQLRRMLRRYPEDKVDICGVILDYLGRTGGSLYDILAENARIYENLFVGSNICDGRLMLQCLLASQSMADDLSKRCSVSFSAVSTLIQDIMRGNNVFTRYVSDPAALLADPSRILGHAIDTIVWQLSDIHFGKLNKLEADPRELAYQIAKAGVEYSSIAPHIFVVSGDVSSIAAPAEFEQFCVFCETLGNAVWGRHYPHRILAIPGNHDIGWQSDGTADRMQRFVEGVAHRGVCITPFGEPEESFASGDVLVKRYMSTEQTVPPITVVTLTDRNIEFVLLISGFYSGVVPEAIRRIIEANSIGRGELMDLLREDKGGVTREYLYNISRLPARQSALRIGVIHHNPIQYGVETCANAFAPQMLETLFRQRIPVIIHGHTHLVEDRGDLRPVLAGKCYPIPAPTLCSECVAGGRGLAIHLIGKCSDQRTLDSIVWEISASSDFKPEQIRLAYRLHIRGNLVELQQGLDESMQ